jgi:hypothetical protein
VVANSVPELEGMEAEHRARALIRAAAPVEDRRSPLPVPTMRVARALRSFERGPTP